MRLPATSLLIATLGAAALSPVQAAAPSWTTAQAQAPVPTLSTAPSPPRSKAAAPAQKPPAAKEEVQPTWAELTPPQQQALAPLAGTWKTLSEGHKRKWLALSQNYPRMSREEQALLHSRMTEWAALTPQQRTQARLNFAETKKLPAQDKKAKWEAYQALPPEEKSKLAAGAAAAKPPAPSTAAAVQPVPPQKLAKVPPRKANSRTPRIAAAPNQVDHNTLLPQPGAAAGP
jgi:hypothetical protein